MKPSLLALDTSTQACSAALCYQGKVTHISQHQPREHAKMLLPMIDKLLVASGIGLAQLDGLAFTRGPGSFTGLRIGMGVIQGLAFGADLPVVPVSTLQTLAQGAIRRGSVVSGGVIMPILDARMHEYYWGLYQETMGLAQPLCEDRLTSPEQIAPFLAQIADAKIHAGLGDGWCYQRLGLTADFCDSSAQPDAVDVLTLALPQFAAGKQQNINDVELFYLRDNRAWKKSEKLK